MEDSVPENTLSRGLLADSPHQNGGQQSEVGPPAARRVQVK